MSGEMPSQNPASARPAAVLTFRLLPDKEKVGSGGYRLPAIAVREYMQAYRYRCYYQRPYFSVVINITFEW